MSAMEIPKPKWKGSKSLIHKLHSLLHSLTNNYASPCVTTTTSIFIVLILQVAKIQWRRQYLFWFMTASEKWSGCVCSRVRKGLWNKKQTNKTWTNLPSVFASQLAGWWCSSLQWNYLNASYLAKAVTWVLLVGDEQTCSSLPAGLEYLSLGQETALQVLSLSALIITGWVTQKGHYRAAKTKVKEFLFLLSKFWPWILHSWQQPWSPSEPLEASPDQWGTMSSKLLPKGT